MKVRFLHGILLVGLALGFCALAIHPRHPESTKIADRKVASAVTSPADIASAISGLELDRAERLLNRHGGECGGNAGFTGQVGIIPRRL